MEFLADTLRLERVLAAIEWLENPERTADERVVGKHAAESRQSFVRVHDDERVHTVLRPQLVAPAALGRRAAQAGAGDLGDLHLPLAHLTAFANSVRNASWSCTRWSWPSVMPTIRALSCFVI